MASNQKAEEGRPNNSPESEETDNDDTIFNGILSRNQGKLAVTSSLHPFWYTKKGGAVIGLVVLTVIGAIVGGAIGGVKASRRQKIDLITSSPPSTCPSQVSNGCSPSIRGIAFSTTTDPSNIV